MKSLKDINQHKNNILYELVDYVPEMTERELNEFKGFIRGGDLGIEVDLKIATLAVKSINKLKNRVINRLNRKVE